MRGEAMSETGPSDPPPCSFEEFRLYYDSTEKVTDRRLNTNRWNYSISVGILLATSAIYAWATQHGDYFPVAALAIALLSALAAVFCLFWLRQVEDWKALNSAKFAVLNDMAQRLQFDSAAGTSTARSYRPFDKEWAILQSKERLRNVRIVKLGQLEALNASGPELFMPKALGTLFGLLFAVAVIVLPFAWSSGAGRVVPEQPAPTSTASTVSPPN
jgi:hypothetical protein